jgi:hypothetical protein
MTIKKGFIHLIIFVSILTISSSVMAVTIDNPLAGGGVNSFPQLLTKIAQAVGTLIASLGTIMIIISGILYLTSAGSPEKINKAKTALGYAIVGIAIGLAATAISTTILNVIGAGTT